LALGLEYLLAPGLKSSSLEALIRALEIIAPLRLLIDLLGVNIIDNDPIYAEECVYTSTSPRGILEI
jgi:hypothetical protein